jgi:hypothetical protein
MYFLATRWARSCGGNSAERAGALGPLLVMHVVSAFDFTEPR